MRHTLQGLCGLQVAHRDLGLQQEQSPQPRLGEAGKVERILDEYQFKRLFESVVRAKERHTHLDSLLLVAHTLSSIG